MHDSIQIEETAADWLARRDGEGWSAADQVALAQWLDASTAHRCGENPPPQGFGRRRTEPSEQ